MDLEIMSSVAETAPTETGERVRIKKVEVLSDNWYILRKTG